MLDRGPQGHSTAERVTHEIDLLVTQLANEGSDVVGHRLEAHRPVYGRCPSVGLQVDTNDLATGGQGREVRAKHLDRTEATVEQQQGLPLAEDLVGELDAVHRRES